MDSIGSVTDPSAQAPQGDVDVQTVLLKKLQDTAKDQSQQLLQALPPPSPPGMGGKVDLRA